MEDVEDSKPPAVELAHDTGEHNVYEVADSSVDGTYDGGADGGSKSSDNISGKAVIRRFLGIHCIRMKRCNIRVRYRVLDVPSIFVRYPMRIMLG